MHIEQLLSPGRTICGLEGASKKRSLELLANAISQDCQHLDSDQLFQSLIARERLGSTGLGQGIAIPHCRIDCCQESIGALITLKEPIDFDAIDGEPVDIIFALLVPAEADEDHLQTLAALASAFSQPQFRQQLRNAQSNQQLFNAAIKAPVAA